MVRAQGAGAVMVCGVQPDEQLIVRLAEGIVRHQPRRAGNCGGDFAVLFEKRCEAMKNNAKVVSEMLAERRKPLIVHGRQQVVCV